MALAGVEAQLEGQRHHGRRGVQEPLDRLIGSGRMPGTHGQLLDVFGRVVAPVLSIDREGQQDAQDGHDPVGFCGGLRELVAQLQDMPALDTAGVQRSAEFADLSAPETPGEALSSIVRTENTRNS